jgi:ribonuclease BN (tRNA processing enzyme)
MGSGGRNFPAFVLTRGGHHLLIDCGPSALPAFKAHGLDTRGIEWILISHFHGDHFGGLPHLFLDFLFVSKPARPVLLLGPTGLQRRFESLLQAAYADLSASNARSPFSYRELLPGEIFEADDLLVETFQMDHGSQTGALGYRIHWGDVVVGYTGDTKWTPTILELAKGCDLLLCECFLFNEEHVAHVRYGEIIEHLGQIESRKILLFHLGPEMLERLGHLDLEVAHDGMVVNLKD